MCVPFGQTGEPEPTVQAVETKPTVPVVETKQIGEPEPVVETEQTGEPEPVEERIGISESISRFFSPSNLKKYSKTSIFIVYTACMSLSFAISIPTVYYAEIGEKDECQIDKKFGVNLSDWGKMAGYTSMLGTLTGIFTMILFCAFENMFNNVSRRIIFVGLFDLFFWILWFIVGIIILATPENENCVKNGKDMAVMTIINLVSLGFFRFLYLISVPIYFNR